MHIILTDAAKKQLDKILQDGEHMRMSLMKSGCCGFALNFYKDRQRKGDFLLNIDGYTFLYTDMEAPLLNGIKEIDFRRNGIMRDFKAIM